MSDSDPYYACKDYGSINNKWMIMKRCRNGDRLMAWNCSFAFACKVVKLLNEENKNEV